MAKNKLLIGTSKGLVILRRTVAGWQIERTLFLGFPVATIFVDERTDTWWVGLAHRHWGQKLQRSTDGGQTWTQTPVPHYPDDARLPSGQPATLRKVWCLAGGGADRPGVLYLGTEPGGLFRSEDDGDNWSLVESLWDHPSRQDQWFGAGRDHPFIHSIVVDPRDSRHYYVAVSCAGVFETRDDGNTWSPRNQGLVAAYLPNPAAEVGHDPHRLYACRSKPDVLWQQNHCGIYRSVDGGRRWEDVSGKDGFPYYGFALAIDHDRPERAWVIPAISDGIRVAVDQALCVCRTDDGGQSWRELREGLPQENCFDIVFRHAMDIDGTTLAFGSTTGNLYLSEDYGESWRALSFNLPRIDAVVFA